MYLQCLPQDLHLINMLPPATDGAARTSDYVKVTNFLKFYLVVQVEGGAATAMDLNPYEADDATPTTEQAIATATRYWYCNATASDDTIAEGTAATSFDTNAAATDKLYVIEIDPTKLTAGYPFVAIKTEGDSASNLLSVLGIGIPRYQQTTQVTAIA